jgi:hypothetical protein
MKFERLVLVGSIQSAAFLGALGLLMSSPASAQSMPKPGAGRCQAYAEQKCGIGRSTTHTQCRRNVLRECSQQGSKK